MASKNRQNKKPIIEYRVELEKKIEINKSFSERRNQAVAMRILSYGLFGQKRYQNLYLTCSLNCFHLALKIANQIHQRVAGLAMIIRFDTVQVLEYFAEEFQGKYFEERKYSKIVIKLTKNPTDDDKKEAGYVPGLQNDEVEEPLTEVLKKKRGQRGFQQKQGYQSHHQPREYQNKNQSKHGYKEKNEDAPPKKRYREVKDERVPNKSQYKKGENKAKGVNKSLNTTSTSKREDSTFKKKDKHYGGQNSGPERRKPQDRGNRRLRGKGRYDDDDD